MEDDTLSKAETKDERTMSSLAVAARIVAIAATSALGLFLVLSPLTIPAIMPLAFYAGYLGLGLMYLAVFLAVCALISILLSAQLKGYGYVLQSIALSAICLLLFGMVFQPWFQAQRAQTGMRRWGGFERLYRLRKSLIKYAGDHEGYLPAADRWCDLLMEYDRRLSGDDFKHPLVEGSLCDFAFNKNLDGLRLSDIPDDVVLLFEASGDWNLTGGPELLIPRDDIDVYVLHVDGAGHWYRFERKGIGTYDKVLKEMVYSPVRWKP
jgi:hypothetical protein